MSTVSYGKATSLVTGRPSPIIWKDCPVIAMLKDPAKGFHVFEDFKSTRMGANGVSGFRWFSYIDSAGTLTLADEEKGGLRLNVDTDDDDSTTIITGDNTTGCITPADKSVNKWWFECRFKTVSITTDDVGFFIGLTEQGQAANTKPLADDTLVVNDIDHVGFRVAYDDGAALDLVWNLAGQTAQETASIQTLEANTYYTVGLKYSPIDNKVHVYVDGVENQDAAFLMSHASAPADCLAVCISLKAGGASVATDYLTIDWVRYASEY